jgi:hypothetical protein
MIHRRTVVQAALVATAASALPKLTEAHVAEPTRDDRVPTPYIVRADALSPGQIEQTDACFPDEPFRSCVPGSPEYAYLAYGAADYATGSLRYEEEAEAYALLQHGEIGPTDVMIRLASLEELRHWFDETTTMRPMAMVIVWEFVTTKRKRDRREEASAWQRGLRAHA